MGQFWRKLSINNIIKPRSKTKKVKKQEGDIKKGETVYNSYFKSRGTQLFLNEEDPETQISYEKMRINLNRNHPRDYDENNNGKKISLWEDIGVLKDTGKDKKYVFDKLGVGISVYFKLLKALIRVLAVMTFLLMPLFYIYSCGSSTADANSTIYISTMLGNLG